MSQVSLSHLAYTANLKQQYQKLCDLPGFVLLQSTDTTRARFDILSAYPYEMLKASKNSASFKDIFLKIQEKIPRHPYDLDLPFQGGAIGFFSYDLACHLSNITIHSQIELSEIPLMDIGLYDWAIIVDHQLKKISVFSANTQKDTYLIVQEILQLWNGNFTEKLTFQLKTEFNPLISKNSYEDSFYAIYEDLRKGRCYQVNYTQAFKALWGGHSFAMYQAISHRNPVPYAAFLHYDYADILCFSPERFITMDNRMLLTSPIKGTARRVLNLEKDKILAEKLLLCPKNRAENIMIVDLMRNDFGKIAKRGSVSVSSLCELESYEAVHHLVSHVRAECLEKLSPIEVFASCFPGGSITGAPKREAMRVIAEHEAYARGVYCGNIGYISSHGRMDFNIAIRTITATDNSLHLAAGGALVIDSTCEEEYAECFTKIAGVLKGLS